MNVKNVMRALGALAFAMVLARAGFAQEPGHSEAHGSVATSSAAVLAQVTHSLERFHDVEAAESEGYKKPWRNDGFMLGEHWFQPEFLRAPVCDLEHPAFLQYLMIEGRRTLIGVGYLCDAVQPTPAGFGPEAAWHRHGPELCRYRSGVFDDASYFATALPNALNDETWQDICSLWWAEPEQREIVMLHSWNWIVHPDGVFAHENRAIPFLRAGLRVRSREELDSPDGRAALDTLRLAHGDVTRRYEGAFLVADLGRYSAWGARRVLRRGQRHAEETVERMRVAEKLDDPVMGSAAAREGAGALAAMQDELAARFDPVTRDVIERFLASLVVHDHHSDDSAAASIE